MTRPAHYWLADMLATVKVPGAETQGRLALIELVLPPNGGPPLHVHDDEDECNLLLEGTVTFYRDDEALPALPGDAVVLPRGVPHTIVAGAAGPARILTVVAPARFDSFIAEVARPAPDPVLPNAPSPSIDLEAVSRIAARHGQRRLGPGGHPPR